MCLLPWFLSCSSSHPHTDTNTHTWGKGLFCLEVFLARYQNYPTNLIFQSPDLHIWKASESRVYVILINKLPRKPPRIRCSVQSLLQCTDTLWQRNYTTFFHAFNCTRRKKTIHTSLKVFCWGIPHNATTIYTHTLSKQDTETAIFSNIGASSVCGRRFFNLRLCLSSLMWFISELWYYKSDRAAALSSCCSLSIH